MPGAMDSLSSAQKPCSLESSSPQFGRSRSGLRKVKFLSIYRAGWRYKVCQLSHSPIRRILLQKWFNYIRTWPFLFASPYLLSTCHLWEEIPPSTAPGSTISCRCTVTIAMGGLSPKGSASNRGERRATGTIIFCFIFTKNDNEETVISKSSSDTDRLGGGSKDSTDWGCELRLVPCF